jgi:xylitol oxidase
MRHPSAHAIRRDRLEAWGRIDAVELRNWAGNVTFSTQRLHAPTTVDQLQQLIADRTHVRALGTGHSFNRIADTTGDLVTVRELPPGFEIDEAKRTVTVPAGARYGEVADALHARGLALHNLGSLPHISVAGAAATGTHGSGNTNRCLAAAAVGVEFVRADGALIHVGEGDHGFGGSVLALGALGIVVRLALAVEPAYEIRQDVWLDAPLDTVLENLDEVMSAGYSVSLFSDPGTPERIDKIWIKSRDVQAVDGRQWGARPAPQAVHPISGQDARAATEQGGVPGPWHERLPHFRASFTPSSGDEQQSEYLVPREHAAAAIAAVHRLDLADVLQVAEFRTVAPDDLWLSPCHGRPTAALHFTWHDDEPGVCAAVAKLESALAPFDPRPHWGKVFGLSPADVQRHYPRLRDFRDLLNEHDPDRKFGNAFLERYVY